MKCLYKQSVFRQSVLLFNYFNVNIQLQSKAIVVVVVVAHYIVFYHVVRYSDFIVYEVDKICIFDLLIP